MSRIPITGLPGALYLGQFLIWALATPAVGVLYVALLAGALLLLPLVFYLNRPGRGSASAVSAAGVLGAVSGLAVVTLVSVREFPFAGLFGVALIAGVLGAPILVWLRSRRQRVSIAPYSPIARR
jgi:hypothetical protein